jgi:malate dehydrogenase (quinone)
MSEKVDVLLVGGGVMSATLGTLLSQLDPAMTIAIVERLDDVAQESSDAWNNAGTGHAGYCELNYTPQGADGSIAIDRALAINASFEVSLQFWSWLVEQGLLAAPENFIRATPHSSFVWGDTDVAFLCQRHRILTRHHLFKDMAFSKDAGQLREWMPLVMQQRDTRKSIAATRVAYGTDVDFGALTRGMVDALLKHRNFSLRNGCTVSRLVRQNNGRWHVTLQSGATGREAVIDAAFVFLGAGGAALPLMQKSGIAEGRGYGGFPVSGQWLVCHNADVIRCHHAKVYGKAPLGAPPMSVPHLDTRIINGQPALLFGPFAGFSGKFLKRGSWFDLPASVRGDNLKSMLGAGMLNVDLVRYLVREVFQSHRQRMDYLRQFFPLARDDEWTLATAGQRVQIIKQGKLEFGTEIVASTDGSLAALLGASPGASVSVQAMIDVVERCFKGRIGHADWQARMAAMVPCRRETLIENESMLRAARNRTLTTLGLV